MARRVQGRLAVVLLLVCSAAAVTGHSWNAQQHAWAFKAWQVQHGRQYKTPEEELARLSVFAANAELVMRHNKYSNASWTMALNEFADLSHAEFVARYVGGYRPRSGRTLAAPAARVAAADAALPSSVNWVTAGAVTGVGNQGQCGGCYAFSAAGAVEGITFITSGVLPNLSEQQIVDCSGPQGNMGCSGGTIDQGFSYIVANGGLCTAYAYPYIAANGQCNASACTPVASISSYVNVAPNDPAAFMAALAKQPVSVAVEADQVGFQFYDSGVFAGKCGSTVDHSVLAVGYGTTSDGTDYYLVKNSWGSSWGEQGYIQLARGASFAPHGQCGILTEPAYPTVDASLGAATPTRRLRHSSGSGRNA